MGLVVGKHYKISLKINNNILTYTCKIISQDEIFISFVDKYGKEYNYNKNLIIGFEPIEVQDDN